VNLKISFTVPLTTSYYLLYIILSIIHHTIYYTSYYLLYIILSWSSKAWKGEEQALRSRHRRVASILMTAGSTLKCRNTLAFVITSLTHLNFFQGRKTWIFNNCKHLFSAFLIKNYFARYSKIFWFALVTFGSLCKRGFFLLPMLLEIQWNLFALFNT